MQSMRSSLRKVGILGGGQLGTFFTIAAKRLGFQVTAWDSHPEAPARLWADHFISADFNDEQACEKFISENEAISFEWENIPLDLLKKIEARRPVRPRSEVLGRLQNRILEKGFLSQHQFPVGPYLPIREPEDLPQAAKTLGFPLICKTATAGYDGLGQFTLNKASDVAMWTSTVKARPEGWILEKQISFQKELAVVVARNQLGQVVTYPVTENIHEAGILRNCRIPANIDSALSLKATELSKAIVSALKGVGVFCIEFFLLSDRSLMVNEIAPRPHNSGHYSLDACDVSQYEMQVRTLCGLPLIPPNLLNPAIMFNILGSEIKALREDEYLQQLLLIPGVKIYDYRKKTVTERRKMGHVTLIAREKAELQAKANKVKRIICSGQTAAPGK